MLFPENQSRFTVQGPVGQLSCSTLGLPDHPKPITFIMCHPDPKAGGTMRNKVVTTCCKAMHLLGIPVVSFDFRGVGHSEGEHDHGDGEREDVLAVVDWVRQARPGTAIWLGGFSFGSYVTYRAAKEIQPEQLLTVAPSCGIRDFTECTSPNVPWTVIVPDADEVVSVADIFDFISRAKQDLHMIKFHGASHFFHGKLIELRQALLDHYRPRIL